MLRLLALAFMLLVTVFSVNVAAAECDASQDPEACQKESGFCGENGDPECREKEPQSCDSDTCAYGNETCIECSGPVEDNVTRGPGDGSCENCRGDTSDLETKPEEDAAGFEAIAVLAAVAAALLVMRRN